MLPPRSVALSLSKTGHSRSEEVRPCETAPKTTWLSSKCKARVPMFPATFTRQRIVPRADRSSKVLICSAISHLWPKMGFQPHHSALNSFLGHLMGGPKIPAERTSPLPRYVWRRMSSTTRDSSAVMARHRSPRRTPAGASCLCAWAPRWLSFVDRGCTAMTEGEGRSFNNR